MPKTGMRHPSPSDFGRRDKEPNIPKNSQTPVPEIEGKAKTGNKKASNIYYNSKHGE